MSFSLFTQVARANDDGVRQALTNRFPEMSLIDPARRLCLRAGKSVSALFRFVFFSLRFSLKWYRAQTFLARPEGLDKGARRMPDITAEAAKEKKKSNVEK